MSLNSFKQLIKDEKLHCPKCKGPIKQFDKYVNRLASVWDGAGDSHSETEGASLVTLICGNDGCAWKERTEYWENYLSD